ncbi:MAG TPA: response regulator [Blastocatellia bacterium]|jgi:CheY-like chemotaxis protein
MTSSQTGQNSIPVSRQERARLLVLDTVKYQKLFDALLGKDYELLVTDNPSEAVQLAASKRPDLILLSHCDDITNGIEASRLIRERVDSPPPILLMLTADKPSLRREAQKAGCAGFLIKPIDPDKLRSIIEESLK